MRVRLVIIWEINAELGFCYRGVCLSFCVLLFVPLTNVPFLELRDVLAKQFGTQVRVARALR
jgi:hypothetical protein